MTRQAFYSDAIYIVTRTQGRGDEIAKTIQLRGFDEIKCFLLTEVQNWDTDNWPDLLIVDSEGDDAGAIKVIQSLKQAVPVVYLADSFEEDTFLTCYDAGAKDFLVKPVNSSYLVSRILILLDGGRVQRQLEKRDAVLKDLSVIGVDSEVYTTEYFLRFLKEEVERLLASEHWAPLCLLVVQFRGMTPELMSQQAFRTKLYAHVAKMLEQCCRGGDIVGEYLMDKFAILLPNTSTNGGQAVSKRILEQLDGETLTFDDQSVQLSVKIGVAEFTGCRHYEEFLNKALDGVRLLDESNEKVHIVTTS
ncbi:MAG: diguanylate cyclase [Vampirovibrio sp.]|nr:diguanylate cyclase [Vampirovibrio sp.]